MPVWAQMLSYETQARLDGLRFVFGVDEVGRGPLAGPVVASAVCLKSYDFDNHINDSKKMTEKSRERAFHEIYDKAWVGVGIISEKVIDEVNILNASFLAMQAAIGDLLRHMPNDLIVDHEFPNQVRLLIDGNAFKSQLPFHYQTIIGGDGKSLSIACASIIAKVSRDRMMDRYHQTFPAYGFDGHKGYPTKAHREAIKAHGPSIIHRKSFTLTV